MLLTLSAFIAFIQPFMALPKKIKKYEGLVSKYKILYYDMQDIRHEIEGDQAYTDKHKKLFQVAKNRRKILEAEQTGFTENKRLNRKCQRAVKRELPGRNFYIPEEV